MGRSETRSINYTERQLPVDKTNQLFEDIPTQYPPVLPGTTHIQSEQISSVLRVCDVSVTKEELTIIYYVLDQPQDLSNIQKGSESSL